VTFTDWANVARTQHAIWIESKAVMGMQTTGQNDGFRNPRWQRALTGRRAQDPDAMEVDLTEIGPGRLGEEERKKLRTEGQCFFCKSQGHISRNCPKKNQRTRGVPFQRPRTMNARTIEADEETVVEVAATSVPDRRAVLKGIQGMSQEERSTLLNELIMTDQPASSSF
jgi:hypothetical protein